MKIGQFEISPVAAWYDAWIGVYYDRGKRRVFIFPVPFLGVCVAWGRSEAMWRAMNRALEDPTKDE